MNHSHIGLTVRRMVDRAVRALNLREPRDMQVPFRIGSAAGGRREISVEVKVRSGPFGGPLRVTIFDWGGRENTGAYGVVKGQLKMTSDRILFRPFEFRVFFQKMDDGSIQVDHNHPQNNFGQREEVA